MKFEDNPFFLLGASPRDSKRAIHEKAEDKSFELEEERCGNAERILLNPKKRLEAELSWFPGMSPNKTKEILNRIAEDAKNSAYDSDFFLQLEGLSRANAIAFFLESIPTEGTWPREEIESVVRDFCEAASEADAGRIIDLINEDRLASGFPMASSEEEIMSGLEERRRICKDSLNAFFDAQDSCVVVEALTRLVEESTFHGERECDWPLLDDIMADYEIRAASFFERQEKKINSALVGMTTDMEAKKPWIRMQSNFDALKDDVLQWDRVAQPIQVLLRSKGVDHKRSKALSERLRDFALFAHNRHGYTDLSMKITDLQQSVFAELRGAAETAAADKKQLQVILGEQKKQEARKKELQYFCEWGLLVKSSVRFDSESITINGTDVYELEDITGVLWSVARGNAFVFGSKYNVSFVANDQFVRVPIKDGVVFENVTRRLWMTAGASILFSALDKLKKGRCVSFGSIRVFNEGVELPRKRWFSFEPRTRLVEWGGMERPVSLNGTLVIRSKDGSYEASLDYETEYNALVLTCILETVFKRQGARTATEAFHE